ncbi:unnamed protein product [Fraxinus pennsylvanica]|uniref:Uncharacterized protein n=1 Tax=Fraxinus pennsylvanica TaxID=56036 RepID=A0AAD1ZF93_9LAMI|nr:unnamed protein product [Fraxinus pennsylvanica]
MLLRSSSIPVLGSLLSSLSEIPYNNHYQYEAPNATPTSIHQKLSYGSQHHPKSLWHSSPSSTSQSSPSGFQRVQSDGNLEELANVDEFSFSNCKRNLRVKLTAPGWSQSHLSRRATWKLVKKMKTETRTMKRKRKKMNGTSKVLRKTEERYKRMLEESPCNPLFLRNHAQFLYQTKGDLQGAEYYSMASTTA